MSRSTFSILARGGQLARLRWIARPLASAQLPSLLSQGEGNTGGGTSRGIWGTVAGSAPGPAGGRVEGQAVRRRGVVASPPEDKLVGARQVLQHIKALAQNDHGLRVAETAAQLRRTEPMVIACMRHFNLEDVVVVLYSYARIGAVPGGTLLPQDVHASTMESPHALPPSPPVPTTTHRVMGACGVKRRGSEMLLADACCRSRVRKAPFLADGLLMTHPLPRCRQGRG